MGLNTNFNESPYFDDFNETNNYHRVLFKPEVAVQARELTQLQTILQNQIERFGENVIKEGSIVKGGNFVEVNPMPYVKILDRVLDSSGSVLSTLNLNDFVGRVAVGQDSGIRANIITVANGAQTTPNETKTIFVKYLNNNQISGENRNTFDDSEEISILDANGGVLYTVTAGGATTDNSLSGGSASVGNGYGVRCGNGVLFQKGHFVRFEDGITIVSRYSDTPSNVVVGFQTAESIITSNQDRTLLDNASGYLNENAPGADRVKLTPTLVTKTTSEANSDSTFFSIQEYQNGNVIRRRITTQFNSIEKLVEQRTAEESGNYTVRDFRVKMEQSTSNTDLLAVNISPGVAYVEGKRVEVINNFNIEIPEPKADDYEEIQNENLTTNYGQYIITSSSSGLRFNVEDLEQVQLFSNNSVVGTAHIRNVVEQGDGNHRLYLFAIEMNSGERFGDIDAVKSTTSAVDGNVAITDTTLYDFNFRNTVYPIGRDFIRAIDTNSQYTYRGVLENYTISSNTVQISISDTFPYTVGQALNEDQLRDIVVVNTNAGEKVNVVSATPASSSVLNVEVDTDAITVDTYYNAIKSATSINTKTYGTYFVSIDTSTHPNGTSGPYCLGVPDVTEIVSISNGSTDYTNDFVFDDGQRDTYYGLSFIRKKASATVTGTLTVEFKAFRHTTGASFFCVNSYPVDDTSTVLPTNKIRTEEIPSYITESGNTIYLRDAIDFRPHAANTAAYSTTSGGATSNPSESLSFDGTKVNFPAPNELVFLDYSYNIGRYDRLIIDDQGTFRVLQGIAANDPSVPAAPNKGMSVAVLKLPPFPSVPSSVANRVGKPDYGIGVVPENNRRYTMRDIGKIESRIKTLEYYTSLNLLEKQTKDLVITDGQGVDRFKNGILVDNFANLSIGNVKNAEFSAAVDPSYKELTPKFRSYPIGLKTTGTSLNIEDYGQAATLTKEDVLLLEQPYATNRKSCTTDFYKYTGAMTIYPEHDSAPDVSRAPDINIEIDLATPFMEFTEALSEFVPLQNVTTEVVAQETRRTGGFLGFFRRRTTTQTIATTTDTLEVSEGETVTNSLGDFVTDIQFEPYLRSKDIEISVTGLRPNTRFYFFFDGKDVNAHIAKGQVIDGAVVPITDFSASNIITSDDNGALYAVFRIPEETFYVGDRLLEIFDSPTYADAESATSSASHNYSGFNFSYTRTGQTVSTRQPRIAIESETVLTTRTRRRGGSDPIAQTFAIDPDQSNDNSVMITKLDLYFQSKSLTNNGVTIAIVETLNGYPTGKIVPFSEVNVPVGNITATGSGATTPTVVTFPAPVALRTNIEYAIVIAPDANDPDYYVWISRTGGADVDTGEAVTQDTNAGVLFTSTNAKAWTPYQDENLKFTLYRANYTAANGYIDLTNADNEFLRVDDVSATRFEVGERVYVTANNNTGVVSGSAGNTTITGSSTDFPAELNVGDWIVIESEGRVHQIADISSNTELTLATPLIESVSANTFFVTATGNVAYQNNRTPQTIILENSSARVVSGGPNSVFANSDIIVGERSGAQATIVELADQKVSYLQPSIFRSNFTKTSTTASITTTTPNKNISFNTNNYMTSDAVVIKSKSNEVVDDNGDKSFSLRIELDTTIENVTATSPFIDYDISNVMVYEYLINNPSPTNEETFGGDATTKYVSKTVELKDGLDAEDMKVFLTAYRPTAGDIEVYVRFQSQYDNRNFDVIEWTPMTLKPETNSYSSLSNRYDFVELEFELGDTAKTAGQGAWLNNDVVRYISEDGSIYDDYKKFAVKIVLLSDNHYSVPRVKDLRAIAVS